MVPFHGTFSLHGKAQASLALLIWLNENVILSEHKFTRFIFIMRKPLIFFNSSFACQDMRNLSFVLFHQVLQQAYALLYGVAFLFAFVDFVACVLHLLLGIGEAGAAPAHGVQIS